MSFKGFTFFKGETFFASKKKPESICPPVFIYFALANIIC